MKANELRIGNLLLSYGRVCDVRRVDEDGCIINMHDTGRGDDAYIDGLNPIPLTEEWLVKFGFAYKQGSYLHNHETSFFTLTGDLPDELDLYGGSGGVGATIKFVHQLQNLYFCLTGEELKLKE